MSAVEDLANALGMVLGKLAESAEHFNMALVAWEEGSAGLAVLHGTNDVEAQQVLANHGIGRDQLIQAREVLGRCSEQIRNYGSSIGANPAPTTGAISRGTGAREGHPESRQGAYDHRPERAFRSAPAHNVPPTPPSTATRASGRLISTVVT